MNKTRTTRSHSHSPFVAATGSHTSFSSAKHGPNEFGLWPVNHAGALRTNLPSAASVVMVREDGQCELSIDDSYVIDYQATPVMGAPPRYVAGNAFFNYDLYGGLRKGGSVSFLAPSYRGYALAAFLSGYVYVVVMYLLLRLPDKDLYLQESTSLKNVMSLQWTVVLLVGFVSDSYAPFRHRRKSYVIAGWAASSVFWIVLFLVFRFASPPPHAATVVLLILAFLSVVVATNAMDIRIIELSQQEELQLRGRLIGSYEVIRISAQLVTHSLIAIIVHPDERNLDIHLPFRVDFVFLHLAVVCAAPIYWLFKNAYEEPTPARGTAVAAVAPAEATADLPRLPTAPASQFRVVLQTFWQCAQQRVVWQLILFNCVIIFFGMFELSDTRRALQLWTRESATVRLVRNCVGDLAFVVALMVWRVFGINANWRKVTVGALVSGCLAFFATSSLVIYDVIRAPWICTLGWALKAPLRVLILLAAFVPTIEIAPAGTEGTTYALLAAFQSVVKLLAAEIARGIVKSWPDIQYNYKAIKQSSQHTENAQFYGSIVVTIWMLCGVSGVFLLPKQKLDAQQLRAYGGYSTLPLVVLIVGFTAAFPYVFYSQILRV